MKVRWTEQISVSRMMSIWETYPEANSHDFDENYEGEVIGTTKNIWGNTFLSVACTDGKIRDCEQSLATVIE